MGTTDPAIPVLKFHQGLFHTISQAVATSGAPPASNDFKGWVDQAWEYERQKTLEHTISGGHSVSSLTHPSFLSAFKREQPSHPLMHFLAPPSKAAGFSILLCNPQPPGPSCQGMTSFLLQSCLGVFPTLTSDTFSILWTLTTSHFQKCFGVLPTPSPFQ